MTNTGNSLRRRYGGHTPEWYDERTDYMSGFLTGERVQTLRRTLAMRTRYMTILTENTFHPQNASALVRHCEAFGVQDLHTVETMCRFDPSVNIVRGTDKWIDIIRHDSTEEAIASLKALAAHAVVGCGVAALGGRVQRGDVPLGDVVGARRATHTRTPFRRGVRACKIIPKMIIRRIK